MAFLIQIGFSIFLGGLGGLASYLKTVSEGGAFRPLLLVVNTILAMIVGGFTGTFLPPEMLYRDAMIAFCGYMTSPILSLLQKEGYLIIGDYEKKLDRKREELEK